MAIKRTDKSTQARNQHSHVMINILTLQFLWNVMDNAYTNLMLI